jgi:hypothetical protein
MLDELSISYRHIQWAPWHLVLDAIGVALLLAAWLSNEPPFARRLFEGLATLFLLLGASFRHLAVKDKGDHLDICFGPVPLSRRRVRYEDIRPVEVGRTVLLESWGVHTSPRGGWVWNIWGRDCVVIHLETGTFRLGTDDATNLEAFLRQRIGSA